MLFMLRGYSFALLVLVFSAHEVFAFHLIRDISGSVDQGLFRVPLPLLIVVVALMLDRHPDCLDVSYHFVADPGNA
jgi:hypothetical protein